MKEEILKKAIERLDDIKKEIIDKISSYEDLIEKYKESNKELENNDSIGVYNDKIEKWDKSIKSCDEVRGIILYMNNFIYEQKNIVNQILNYNLTFGDLDKFFDLVLKIDGLNAQSWYKDSYNISKATTIKFPYKSSDLSNFNQIRVVILMKADTALKEKQYLGYTSNDKLMVAKEIVEMIKKSPMLEYYDKLSKFFTDNLKQIEIIKKENEDKIKEIEESEIIKRKVEINNHIKELEEKIKECKNSLVSIDEIYSLYDEYKNTESSDVLLKLTEELTNLVVISQRESKIITYEKEEKVEETKDLVKEEIDKPLSSVEVKVLDSDYFRKKDTVRLICFLGEDGNDLISDINYYFDKSVKNKVLERLDSIFNSLFQDKNYISRAGGDPDNTTSKKTLKLLEPPYNFTYRRYAEGGDKFRIHAIRRYSKLLQELGYGEGNIVFFGAVGPNTDTEKWKTYDRLGGRAVEKVGESRVISKLVPSFNYIEHITRGFIPSSLLSEDDLQKLKNGSFNSLLPGKIEQSIENSKYILFDVLDETSKSNVKKWLDEYFIKQTNKLFEIKDMYNKLKGNTLD